MIRLLVSDSGLHNVPHCTSQTVVQWPSPPTLHGFAALFLVTASMANAGGAASAPIVAGVYLPAMAPVGLLMGVAGYILGIYAALGCSWLIRLIAVGL